MLNGLLRELDMPIVMTVVIQCDSTAAIQIVSNPVFYGTTKHIDIDCHFIMEKIQEGLVAIQYTPSCEQPADVLTKGLGRAHYEYLISKHGMKNILISPSLKGGIEEYAKSIVES